MAGGVLGLQCSITIGGASAIGVLSGSHGALTRGAREIIAGSVASPLQGIIGYQVGAGKSGISVAFKLPYAGAQSLLNAALSADPITVNIGFGTAGGLTLTNALLENLQASGQESQDISCTASFESTDLLAEGSGGSPVGLDFYKFSDVDSVSGPGISTTKVRGFTLRVQRKIAEFRGNSPDGIAQDLQIAWTKAMMDLEYKLESQGASLAATTIPLTVADAVVTLSGKPLLSTGGTGSMSLTCAQAFHDPSPTTSGGDTDYTTEKSTLISSTGTFTIG